MFVLFFLVFFVSGMCTLCGSNYLLFDLFFSSLFFFLAFLCAFFLAIRLMSRGTEVDVDNSYLKG